LGVIYANIGVNRKEFDSGCDNSGAKDISQDEEIIFIGLETMEIINLLGSSQLSSRTQSPQVLSSCFSNSDPFDKTCKTSYNIKQL
jgi:hypothetical protein